jgi:2'-5' RNA ligase
MPRLFAAIETPPHVALALSGLRAHIPGARWVEPEDYHLTLRFAGDVEDRQADDFAGALDEVDMECFDVELSGLGSFGGRKPRSIWIGAAPSEPLLRLHKLTERAARRAGLEPEGQKYAPHVTLARLRQCKAGDVADYLAQFSKPGALTFRARRFVLFSSRPHGGGGPYVVEEAYPLRDGESDEAG